MRNPCTCMSCRVLSHLVLFFSCFVLSCLILSCHAVCLMWYDVVWRALLCNHLWSDLIISSYLYLLMHDVLQLLMLMNYFVPMMHPIQNHDQLLNDHEDHHLHVHVHVNTSISDLSSHGIMYMSSYHIISYAIHVINSHVDAHMAHSNSLDVDCTERELNYYKHM